MFSSPRCNIDDNGNILILNEQLDTELWIVLIDCILYGLLLEGRLRTILTWPRVMWSDQFADSVQGLRLSRAFRLCGCGAAGGWGLGPGDGEAEGAGEAAAAADMCGGGEGGESLSSPDICIEREYSTVQYSTVQYSAVQYSTVQYHGATVIGNRGVQAPDM